MTRYGFGFGDGKQKGRRMIADEYRKKTAGMTETPWHKCGANEGDCKCGQITSIPADCGVATFHFGHSEDGFPYPSRPERNHNIDGTCFLANTRSEVADLIERVEFVLNQVPEDSVMIKHAEGYRTAQANLRMPYEFLREKMEELE